MYNKWLFLASLFMISFVIGKEDNFWLHPGQSSYTVINGNNSYVEVIINEPSRNMALLATDNYYVLYNDLGSFNCTGHICGVGKVNYRSIQDCGLSEVCNDFKCTAGLTTIIYNKKGYPVIGNRRIHPLFKEQEILKDFKVHNFTADEAYNRILYLMGYLSTSK